MTERFTSSSVPVRASGEPQKQTIRVISHGPTLIERAQQWQREHAEANTPFPDDTYLLIRDFLIAASPSDDAEVPMEYHVEPDAEGAGDWHVVTFSTGRRVQIFTQHPLVIVDPEVH